MVLISNHDLNVLGIYKFISDECAHSGKNRRENNQLLCLKNGKLALVNRSDATPWNFVKKFFGCGKLAGANLSLKKISAYLATHDLSGIGSETAAYQTIHGIASRCLFYNKDRARLWKQIGFPVQATVEEARKTYYSWRTNPSSGYEQLRQSTLTVYATEAAQLDHLRIQVESTVQAAGKKVWECEPVGFAEWIHGGYQYEGASRGYVYQRPRLCVPTLSGQRKVSQMPRESLRFRCVTEVSLPCQSSLYSHFSY